MGEIIFRNPIDKPMYGIIVGVDELTKDYIVLIEDCGKGTRETFVNQKDVIEKF